MSNLENTNINVKEIKSELSELIYDKEIKEALIQYKDEE